MEHFERVCKQNKMKITPQRVLIYKEMLDDKSHPTADVVYRRIRKKLPSISFDTVNRTLNLFSQIGLIDTLECSGRGKRYDPFTDEHHHLKCTECHSIIDVYNPELGAVTIPSDIADTFTVTNVKVLLTGVCKKCAQKGEK